VKLQDHFRTLAHPITDSVDSNWHKKVIFQGIVFVEIMWLVIPFDTYPEQTPLPAEVLLIIPRFPRGFDSEGIRNDPL